MRSRPPSRSTLAKLWGDISVATLRRQALAAAKAECYADTFLELVVDRIKPRYTDPERRKQMCKFASTTVNVTRSIADLVACCYAQGVRRTLADADESLASDWAALIDESRAVELQETWNVGAWLCGPTLVIPHVDASSLRLQLDVVRPDQYDAQLGPGRSLLAVLWRCDDANQWVLLDRAQWRYFDEAGEPTGAVPHALGYVPAAVMRSRPEVFGGFWGASAGQGLLDASLDAAVVYAQLSWYRTVQVGYLTTMAGNGEKFGSGQSLAEPEVPVTYDGDPSEMAVSVLSRDVAVANFLQHITAIISFQVQQHGIPASEATFQQDANNWGALSLSVRPEKLARLRAAQVPHLLRGERDLWPMVADVVGRSSHRLAGVMPPRAEVERRLAVEFPEIEGTADPIKRLELFKAEVAEGFTNRVEYFQQKHSTLPANECAKRIAKNRADHFADIEAAAARNISHDPEKGLQSIAQRQGAIGGQTRATNASQQENTP